MCVCHFSDIIISRDKVKTNNFSMDGGEESLILVSNYQEICRLCLQSKRAMTNIFEDEILNEQIAQIVGIQCDDNDELPSIICHKCRYIVEVAFELRLLAAESHKVLMMAAYKPCRLDPLDMDEKQDEITRESIISLDIKNEIEDCVDDDTVLRDMETSYFEDNNKTSNHGDENKDCTEGEKGDTEYQKLHSGFKHLARNRSRCNKTEKISGEGTPSRKRKRSLPNEENVIRKEFHHDDSNDDKSIEDNFEATLSFLESDHNTDSEQSENEEDPELGVVGPLSRVKGELIDKVTEGTLPYYYGKNRFKWAASEPPCTAQTQHYMDTIPSSSSTTSFTSYQGLWNLFFTNNMIDLIIQHTNKELLSYKTSYKDQTKSELNPTNSEEMKAFIGLILFTSVFRCNRDNADLIFATDGSGREIFRCVMSKLRFLILLHCLRFEDRETKPTLLNENKIAAISEIFNLFIENCQNNYTPGTYVCVDELLISFRGKCSFVVYMPSKLAKYGLKLLLLVDAKTFYVYNAYIYYGEGSHSDGLSENEKKLSIPTQSVIRLCKVIENSHRNVTADNWFSSLELMQSLKERGLTYLGTLKKNTKEIPPQFQARKERKVGSYLYGFTKDYTILSYVPKPEKTVILISSMHHKKEVDPKNKPIMLSDYNQTQGGVNEIGKKCAKYSCSRRTSRWPLAIFCRLLDISGINSFIIYEGCVNVKKITRGSFLLSLARDLVLPHVKLRVYNERLPRELRVTIQRVIGSKDMPEPPPAKVSTSEEQSIPLKRMTCVVCPSRLRRRTKYACCVCKKPICLGCSHNVCVMCKELIC